MANGIPERFTGQSLREFNNLGHRQRILMTLVGLRLVGEEDHPRINIYADVYATYTDENHDPTMNSGMSADRYLSGQRVLHVYFMDVDVIPQSLVQNSFYFLMNGDVWLIEAQVNTTHGLRGYRIINATNELIARYNLRVLKQLALYLEHKGGGSIESTGGTVDFITDWLEFCPVIEPMQECLEELEGNYLFDLRLGEKILLSNTDTLFSSSTLRYSSKRLPVEV